MYGYPVSLPAFSNREDFFLTLSLFDDDLNQPINLAGITLAPANANGLTGGTWNVAVGSIATTSSTLITIPPYPISNQLSALSLTVGAGLAIVPGNAVLIADPTGKNTMVGTVTSYNSTTGALVCQIGMTYQFEIRTTRPYFPNVDYVPFYDFGAGSYPFPNPLLAATLGGASISGVSGVGTILVVDLGVLQITIPESIFKQLVINRTYQVGMTMFDGVNTRQLFIADLPVSYGGVTN